MKVKMAKLAWIRDENGNGGFNCRCGTRVSPADWLAEFAAALGLDAAAEYTRAEIARALTPDARDTYARELSTAELV